VTFANTIAKLLSSDVRVVAGYPGVAAITLAMQRNEVNCKRRSGMVLHEGPRWLSSCARPLNVIVQWGTASDPDISSVAGHDVPLILDYARSDSDRNALRCSRPRPHSAGRSWLRPTCPPSVSASCGKRSTRR